MSVSQAVGRELPYLRRFARAVTGGQASGDAAVRGLLENAPALDGSLADRVALFQALSAQLLVLEAGSSADEAAPDRHLQQLSPLSRQAFLLTAVEGFGEVEVAGILNMSAADVQETLDTSRREIASDLATDVMVIEDEPLIAIELEDLVTELGHRLVGVARTRDEAVSLAKRSQPKLCLADIQLADNTSGIDAVNEILGGVEIPVIFITAFPERFLTGDRPEPAFLISKPFDRDAVQAQISQALFFEAHAKRSG